MSESDLCVLYHKVYVKVITSGTAEGLEECMPLSIVETEWGVTGVGDVTATYLIDWLIDHQGDLDYEKRAKGDRTGRSEGGGRRLIDHNDWKAWRAEDPASVEDATYPHSHAQAHEQSTHTHMASERNTYKQQANCRVLTASAHLATRGVSMRETL